MDNYTKAARPMTHAPHSLLVEPTVRAALLEDMGRAGDITTQFCLVADGRSTAKLIARRYGKISGLICAETAFRLVDPSLDFELKTSDGYYADQGDPLAIIHGSSASILTAERVALNFVGHLSGIANATFDLVNAVKGTNTRIVCTRKTTPGLRILEKYAVRCGEGFNHRFGLDDAVLIKDNHIVAAKGITNAVKRARAGLGHMVKIEVEVDNLDQLIEALELKVDTILLDNMNLGMLREAVKLTGSKAILEASGSVTLATVRAIAETGVDYISAGSITHSAPNFDVGLDF